MARIREASYLRVIVFWIGLMLGGLALALFGCRRALSHAEALASSTRLPPFVVGITLVSVGTDLPEIANSVASCLAGHGDLNLGDSVGSAVTQATLVLGLLPLLVGPFAMDRRRVAVSGLASVVALAAGTLLVADGYLSRSDGAAWLLLWLGGSLLIWRYAPGAAPALRVPVRSRMVHALAALGMLALVGFGAALAVRGFIEISSHLGVPEYLLSFFAVSIGTSLPELLVDWTALRRGLTDLAVGDILGSTFVDATLSIGIGPLIAPAAVSAGLAVRGSWLAAVAILLVVGLLLLVRGNGRITGLVLLALYGSLYLVLLR